MKIPNLSMHRSRPPGWATVAALVTLLTACGGESSTPAAKRGTPAGAHLVTVLSVARESAAVTSEHTGTLRARRTLRVFTQEEGRITSLPFYEGDRVKQGDVLLRLDDALLKAELDKTLANRRQAELDLRRLSKLQQQKLVSDDERARAATALDVARAEERVLRTRLGYAVETAPFGGLVSERLAEPGDVVAPNTHVLTITDPSSLVTELSVSELILPDVAVGDPVRVRIDALGDQTFSGKVLRIHPTLDPRSRHGVVEVAIEPVPVGARAGQFCRVTLTTAERERLLIPFLALRRDRSGDFVYRLDKERKVHRVAVRAGRNVGDRVEILEGLAAGDPVVTRGFLGLREGMVVDVVDQTVDRGP